jgi:hypothetical protein
LTDWLPKRHKVQRNVRFKFDDGVEREADKPAIRSDIERMLAS